MKFFKALVSNNKGGLIVGFKTDSIPSRLNKAGLLKIWLYLPTYYAKWHKTGRSFCLKPVMKH
ncbi:hypothetical protein AQ505_20775 [Pedobacter sp. PACM 27299]|nr:hypothetical protein AQ505_20775 [Pedobacter sp. PACM 27299]